MEISVSVMCMDHGNMVEQFRMLNGFADSYHWDIMDGNYVPNVTLGPDAIDSLRSVIEKPIHVHLMVTRPQDYVGQLIDLQVAGISFHLDTVTSQAFRLADLVHDAGIGVGIVLNPIEPVYALEYIMDQLDSITVMTVDPGFAGQRFIHPMLRKISHLKELKEKNGYKYTIEVDGAVNRMTLDSLRRAGAERLVLGSSGLFGLGEDLSESIRLARDYIVAQADR